MTEPREWGVVDYRVPSLTLSGSLQWDIAESQDFHFLALWFETTLWNDVGFSNRPGARGPSIYKRLFLPLAEPVAALAGDTIGLLLRVLSGDRGRHFDWRTTLSRPGHSQPIVRLKQNTLLSSPPPKLRP